MVSLILSTLTFVGRFSKRPMHFFGLWGTLFFVFGFFMQLVSYHRKIIYTDYGITNKPLFFIALTAMIIGMQLFLAGFIGRT